MKAILANLFDRLFGCWHSNMSFPISVKRGQARCAAAWRTGTYIVCLDCGREFAYDWQTMAIVPEERWDSHAHSFESRTT